MIVNEVGDRGLEIIFQPAHALLSAQVAGHWHVDSRPAHWWQTLNAVAQHDNGWVEWEQAPGRNERGVPRNFTEMSLDEAVAQWKRGITRGRHQSRWVALLISRHATRLNGPRAGESPEVDAFLSRQAELQQSWMEGLGVTAAQVERAYTMIRWTDWFSLLLCWRRLPDDGSAVSVGSGPDGRSYMMRRREDGSVTVDPWPFDLPRFAVSVERRRLDQRTFEDDESLRRAVLAAPLSVRRWTLEQ